MVNQHAATVDAWLERFASDVPPDVVLRLFEAALSALWARSATTLGTVTLTAIAERVLHDASAKYPLFTKLRAEPDRGFQCGPLREQLGSIEPSELLAGIRFVLVELLSVLGRLTAEILTPGLQTELARVGLPKPRPVKKRDPIQLSRRRRTENKP